VPASDDPPWLRFNDVYGKWLDGETGLPVGPDILIFEGEHDQSMITFDYSPLMDRFLIAWWDFNAENDYEPLPDVWGADPLWHIPMALLSGGMDIRGAVYGSPSFLSGRVIEKGTGNPVEDARVLVIGPSLPVVKQTNEHGWFNIVEDSQRAGKYLVVVLKFGYPPGIQLVDYAGDPLRETIEMNKWW
ncbi:MAG: carboxypeptidase regulatory-like domain-containing protein, partial [Deltaproteobacteria bacterium]|nr:carboxypeptidase regulatory-like domain-containing protein [Deltaproteobacteria bacterium]